MERLRGNVDQRWTLTGASADGAVREHFGGTYRASGNQYVETIDYSLDANDPNWAGA